VKVLVAYMSKTGNTKKVAEAIFESISDEKEITRIEDIDSVEGYDVVFLGFPIHGEGPDKNTVRLLQKHRVQGRKVALFITHAAPEGDVSKELQEWLEKFRQAAGRANIVGLFDCQGQLAKPIKVLMSIMPNPKYRMWAKMDNSQGQPDETRLDRAQIFSQNVMGRVHDAKQAPVAEVA